MIKEIYCIKPQAKTDDVLLNDEIKAKLSQVRALAGVLSRTASGECDEADVTQYKKIFWLIEDMIDHIELVHEALASPRLVSNRKEATNG